MPITVSLREIIDALEMQFDELSNYLDQETGEVCSVSHDTLSLAESGDSPDALPGWQRQEFETARLILESDRFLKLPSGWDIHEWEIMQRFSFSLKRASVRDALLSALHGPGAFRCFKAALRRFRLQEAWFEYRSQALRRIAIEWCQEHGIPYQEG